MLLSRSPLASLRRGVPFDLHVLGAPPAFILSRIELSVQNVWASSPSGPLSSSLIGSVRFIWFYLIGKGISRGRLSAALRKQIQVRPFQMVRCLPGCDTEVSVHPRSIRFSRCTPARLIRSNRAARQGDILPDRRGAGGGNRALHIFSQMNSPSLPPLRLKLRGGFWGWGRPGGFCVWGMGHSSLLFIPKGFLFFFPRW